MPWEKLGIRQDSKLNTNDPLKKQLRRKAGQANRVSALVAARVKTGQHVDPKDK